jgi:ABC-type uncharacterized transport system involved in gliding motility auxiliary subunit
LTMNQGNNEQSVRQYTPFLCGFGLLLLVLALGIAYIEQTASALAIGLVVFGVLALLGFFSVIARPQDKLLIPAQKSTSTARSRWKRFAIVVTMTVGSVVFIGTSHYLANSSTIRWDLTRDQQHTLSKNTIDFIGSLESPVTLTAFYVGMPPKYLEDLFNEYERLSAGLISTQIVDPIEKIAFAAKFGNVVNGEERKVIVQSNDSRKDVDFTEDFLTEEKLTNAIARASRAPRQVYFLTGHGEYSIEDEKNSGLSIFKKLLTDNNIASKPLMLGISQSIPDDCDVLIIAGPHSKLTAQETQRISDYLIAGGDALFLIEHTVIAAPNKPLTAQQLHENPDLNGILNQWGVDVQADIVVDLTNYVGDDVGSPATKNYKRHKAITEGLDYTFYVRPRSIQILEKRRPAIKIAPIVLTQSTSNSWAETNRNLEIAFDKNLDTAGPVPISYVLFEEQATNKGDGNNTLATRLIVFTDADFLTNSYIEQYSNAQMGLNSVNWLAELEYKVFLGSKDIQVEQLNLTSKEKRQVAVILLLLPLVLAIAGLIVWLRAKVTF